MSVPCEDSIYYEESANATMQAVADSISKGRLGMPQCQDILLVRHEDRIAWIQVDNKSKWRNFELRITISGV